jgi:hypothetical protein
MSKILHIVFVSILMSFSFVSPLFGTTSVTGNLQDAGGAVVSGRVFVRFWLRGCNSNQPRAAGIALIAPAGAPGYYKDFTPNASGAISGSIYKNSEIECGGQTGVTWWGVQVYRDGKPGPETPYTINGAFNLNSATPNTTNPVVPAPIGDTTYCRIDAGNCGFTGSPLPSANNTYDLGTSGAGWRDLWLSRALKPMSNNAVDLGTSALGFRTGYFSTSILPVTDNAVDLGSASFGFRTGYFSASILPVTNNTVDIGSSSFAFRKIFTPLIGPTGNATIFSATDQIVGRATTDTLSNKTLQSPTVISGISQGSGFKHQRFGATCTTGANQFDSCITSYTWSSAFANASYTVTCTLIGPVTQRPVISDVLNKTAGGFQLSIFTALAASSSAPQVDCIAVHD